MSRSVEVSEQHNGQQIERNQQRTLRVTVPEVPASGFRWSLRTCGDTSCGSLPRHTAGRAGSTGRGAQHAAATKIQRRLSCTMPGRVEHFSIPKIIQLI